MNIYLKSRDDILSISKVPTNPLNFLTIIFYVSSNRLSFNLQTKYSKIFNKTPDYNRDISVLHFFKDSFRKRNTFFFQKNTLRIFSDFPKFRSFLFLLWKNFAIESAQDIFKKTYHFISILQYTYQPTNFEKKNQVCFQKNLLFLKKDLSYIFEKSFYFSLILWQICHSLVMESFLTQTRHPTRSIG